MKFRYIYRKLNIGFTLIEMMIVLALLGIVLSGLYTFFSFSQKVYCSTQAQNIAQDDMNSVLNKMANEIRSASKPNASTRSVVVYKGDTTAASGDRMDIYILKDGKYNKVSYKYTGNTLQCGTVQKETSGEIIAANITYSAILNNVQYPSANELFEDITVDPPSPARENDKRTIRIDLIVTDNEGGLTQKYEIKAEYTSRSKGAS